MILRSADPGEILRVNGAFTEQFGLTSEELAARPFLDWIHPDDRKTMEQELNAGDGSLRARHRTKQDEWTFLEWRVMRNSGNAVALGLLEDESDAATKADGSDVPSQRTTLSETLEAMVHIVEAKTDGLRCSILLVDPEHEYVTVGAGPSLPADYNAAVEGLRIGPAVGSCGTASYWNVPIVVEDISQDPLWKDLREAAAIAGVMSCWSVPITGTSGGDVLGAMALYDTKPNAPTQHEMDVLEIAARMVGLAVERDRLEEQLRQATKMEAIGVLAGGVAHDFNNLLTTVMGNAELAMTKLPDDAKARQMLQRIVTASVTATDLCNQMLTYAGRGASSIEIVDCNALVRELGELLKVALSKKVSLVYELDEAPLGVLADRSQLRQVVMNLITNASEAIGGSEGRVVIGASASAYSREELELRDPNATLAPGEYVHLWVTDTGAGISPTTQTKIFDPFFTTKPSGRGLGLAVVQGIVRSHRGAITAESNPGAGTTFSVLLPRVDLPDEDPRMVSERETERRGGRILVVDDEFEVRQILVGSLENAGYSVVQACDGQEAIDVFRRESDSIDCVLLDLSMPKLDGEEVFAELREIRSDVRVILCSGFTEQEMLNRFEGAGLAGVVQKPSQRHILLAKVADALKS